MMMAMIINIMSTKSIGFTQGIMAREISGDIWLSTILAMLQGLGVMLLTVYIIKRLPDRNLVEQMGQILGKWAGYLTGFVLFLFFVGAFTTVMITFVLHLKDYFLPETPTWLILALALTVCTYGLFLGLEVMMRTAILGVLTAVLMNVLIILGSLKQIDIRELQPLLMSGVEETVWASRHMGADFAVATLMAGMLLPQVREPNEWRKSGVWGIFLSGCMLLVWPILELTVITPEMTAQFFLPCMQLSRSAEIGFFFHRYEMMMVALLLVPFFIHLMLCLYCGAKALSNCIGSGKLKYFFAPVVFIGGGLSYYIMDNHINAVEFTANVWPPFALSVAGGLPLVLLVAGFASKRKLQQS